MSLEELNFENLNLEDSVADRDVWKVIEEFFNTHTLAHHQLDSYNHFLTSGIPSAVSKPVVVKIDEEREVIIEFKNIFIDFPTFKEGDGSSHIIYPSQCVDRSITYESAVYADIVVTNPNGIETFYPKYHFASVPTMVNSLYCNLRKVLGDKEKIESLGENSLETGGYFVIKGTKRVLASQERNNVNIVNTRTKPRKTFPKFTHYAEIRSQRTFTGTSTYLGIIADKNTPISVNIPYNDIVIPLGVMFTALGVENMRSVSSLFYPLDERTDSVNDLVTKTLEYSFLIKKKEDALKYIGVKLGKTPNVNLEESFDEWKGVITRVNEDDGTLEWILKTKKRVENKLKKCKDENNEKLIKECLSFLENCITTRESCAEIIASDMLKRDFLPHLGTDFSKKIYFLIYMTRRLLRVLTGKERETDRDHIMNKRVAVSGTLLSEQFYAAFKRVRNDMIKNVHSTMINSNNCAINIKPNFISSSLCGAIADNKWVVNIEDEGIGQVFADFNLMDKLASLRKVANRVHKGEIKGPRVLHGSHWGVLGAFETPESEKCGLVKFLGLTATVSVPCDTSALKEILKDYLLEPEYNNFSLTSVMIDGDLIGFVEDGDKFVKIVRDMRRRLDINPTTSVYERNGFVYLDSCGGRLLRPLFIVEGGELKFSYHMISEGWTWYDYVSNGVVEYLDKSEEEETYISYYPTDVTEEHTHCELHPTSLSSTGDSIIPFSNHNQAPRNAYEAQQCKQAIGITGTNFSSIMRGTSFYMHYPQSPLIYTRMSRLINFDIQPSGFNAIVFIMPWLGANQEDSLIFNKDSIERGMGTVTKLVIYDTVVAVAKDYKNEEVEIIEVPSSDVTNKSIDKLDTDGIVRVGSRVKKDDVLIGKVSLRKDKDGEVEKKINRSVIYDSEIEGTVSKVQRGINGEGFEYIKVQISQVLEVEEGDKASSRHGQKGTCGAKIRSVDLPFTRDGIVPDIIMNPHAIPSRMTCAQLIEMLIGKKICSTSRVLDESVKKLFSNETLKRDRDGTPFNREFSLQTIFDELKAMGLNSFGKEKVRNGTTGVEMEALVFTGVVYYQRLKHIASFKKHARGRTGGRTALTRQPKEGRARNGGGKIGLMERDAIAAHGASGIFRDGMLERSNDYKTPFCSICGLPIIVTNEGVTKPCNVCGNTVSVNVRLPYTTKLLLQELGVANVVPRVVCVNKDAEQMEI